MRTRRYAKAVRERMKEVQVGDYIKIMRGRKLLAIVDWMVDDDADYLYLDIGKNAVILVPKDITVVVDDDTHISGIVEIPVSIRHKK